MCGIILHYKITYNQGIGCIFFGLLISILGISLTQRKANKWKEESEGEYIDSYEIIQQEKLQKSIERENKKKQKFAERQQTLINILNTFKDEMQSEINFLVSRAEVFSKEHEDCKNDTIEEIDEILADIRAFANEMQLECKKIEDSYSELLTQTKKLGFDTEDNNYIQLAANIKNSIIDSTIKSLLDQCRENENNMLQEKIQLLQKGHPTKVD